MKECTNTAFDLENWYASSQGTFALTQEKSLLQRALSPWSRRSHSLLDIQCGTGIFLEFFWEGGFDVTGIDSQHQLVELAHERLNGKAEIQTSVPDYLPFPDNEFDYVALIHVLEHADKASLILSEALRVAAKGVVIAFMNPWSLAFCGNALARCLPWKKQHAPWTAHTHISPWGYYKMLGSVSCNARISVRSALFCPQWAWTFCLPAFSAHSLPLPFGALGVMRIDIKPLHAGKALPLRLKSVRLKNLAPVRIMESSPKDIT